MSPLAAEFIGTTILILLGDGVVANVVLKDTKGHNSGWMVVTTAWALAVFVGVVVAGPASGAHLNPAVTLGLALAGKVAWELTPGYIAAQLAGGFVGSALVWVLYKDHFDRTEEPLLKLAVFCTGPAIRNHPFNLLSEVVGTLVLVFTVLYITGAEITSTRAAIGLGSVGALPVALLVWAIGLALGGTTGYAINPARDLGPRLAHAVLPIRGKGSSEWSYAWIPVAGPLLGGALAAGLHLLLG
ncbi:MULTISPECIES: MIP/aquaporin family protein [Hymenobacter]|uniref:Glycerol uptake facilitator protein n=1 Tax=Hymenobacter mucosus TaxID=1411120 RepID=A0A238YJ78_9BACT|nr:MULTISPECIES: MIP/aquaporin family protein [Hymenobacter]SNR70459.1 glycerol uptake facilitator protein [Hymenobacter mucosus]